MTRRAKLRTIEGVSGWLAFCNLWGAAFMPLAHAITGESLSAVWLLAFAPGGLLMLSVWWMTKKERFATAATLAFANAAVGAALIAAVLYLSVSGLRDAGPPAMIAAAVLFELAVVAFWLWSGRTLNALRLTPA